MPQKTTPKSSPKTTPKSSPKSSPKTADRILVMIEENPQVSTAQMASQLEITKRAVIKQTNRLQEMGAIRHVGPAKGGHWEVC